MTLLQKETSSCPIHRIVHCSKQSEYKQVKAMSSAEGVIETRDGRDPKVSEQVVQRRTMSEIYEPNTPGKHNL